MVPWSQLVPGRDGEVGWASGLKGERGLPRGCLTSETPRSHAAPGTVPQSLACASWEKRRQALESTWIFPAQSYRSSREGCLPRFLSIQWGQPRSMEGYGGHGRHLTRGCSVSQQRCSEMGILATSTGRLQETEQQPEHAATLPAPQEGQWLWERC